MVIQERILEEYTRARLTPSDINEHIPTLFNLAMECQSIVEGGVRYVVSTWAFLYGCAVQGGTVTSYCWNLIPEIQRAIDLCQEAQVPWTFHDGDWLQHEIPETDLLFIDTNHTYEQLTKELRKHGPKAHKYIALHDTVTFAQVGTDGKHPGLWQAITEFIAQDPWSIKAHYTNNNGLTLLERTQ